MLSKNEIKLLETRGTNIIRRLVFTENGFVRLVDDFHFEGIAPSLTDGVLKIEEVSPTVKLYEDDYILEITSDIFGHGERMEPFRYMDGRLRSVSMATNYIPISKAMQRNREILKWVTVDSTSPNYLGVVSRVHQNKTWSTPTALQQSISALKNLIPCKLLWDGSLGVNTRALGASYHKFIRLYLKKSPTLTKRTDLPKISFEEASFLEADVWYIELPTRSVNGATLLRSDAELVNGATIVKISTIGKVNVAKFHTFEEYNNMPIYNIELFEYSKPAAE